MLEVLLFILLPVAAWAGWWFSRATFRRGERRRNRQLSHRYFKGLNYLLNEQPDKAIQVFVQMAEVNRDTVETHLALGSLFRRRGEVDRAIRLHQNIISKRHLDEEQRTMALLELGEDYMRAGLFDRAEKLFSELVDRNISAPSALQNLLDIYQQEKEWERALQIAERLEKADYGRLGSAMSHFCCELATAELDAGAGEKARKHLALARRHDPRSVRAERIAAGIAQQAGDYKSALEYYERMAEWEPDCLADILDDYFDCAERAGQGERARARLIEWAERYDGISVALKQAAFIEEESGRDAAAEFLSGTLSKRPSVRGLRRLVELRGGRGSEDAAISEVLNSIIAGLLRNQAVYRCSHCGFSGHQHHWQCPSCRNWGTTRIIRGILAE